MKRNTNYETIAATQVPASVRFDVPPRLAGQMIEVAYGGFGKAAHDEGDEYRRVTDRTNGAVTYARRVGDAWVE